MSFSSNIAQCHLQVTLELWTHNFAIIIIILFMQHTDYISLFTEKLHAIRKNIKLTLLTFYIKVFSEQVTPTPIN